MTDPDAPGGTFYHWVVVGLAGDTSSLPDGGALPAGAREVRRYVGMCPPAGHRHHYHFMVYSLRHPDGLGAVVSPADAVAALRGEATASGDLVGVFGS